MRIKIGTQRKKMNSIIKKSSLKIGLVLAILQMLITLHLYYNGSFVDTKFGILILLLNVIFGAISIFIVKKKLLDISLREAFSAYMIPIIFSILIWSSFYFLFFKTFATEEKKEKIKIEIADFQLKNMQLNDFSKADIKKNIELSKEISPFDFGVVFQSAFRYFILYAILGIIIAFIFKNKSSFQEPK